MNEPELGRASGVLLPLFSLPSPYGIGTMGRAACEFLDLLHEAGQSWWQLLPLGPTGYGDSPYQSLSSFAGNPYFIDLDLLAEEGLLGKAELTAVDWGDDLSAVDYGVMFCEREKLLAKAYERALLPENAEIEAAFRAPCFEGDRLVFFRGESAETVDVSLQRDGAPVFLAQLLKGQRE